MPSSIRKALLQVLKTHQHYRSYALAWNVKIYGNITEPNDGPNKVKDWDFDQESNWALEDMCRMVTGRENDWLSTLPAVERFPRFYDKIHPTDRCYYPAKLKGWKLVEAYKSVSVDVDFSFEGRSSGWLVLTEFESRSGDLIEQIEEGGVSNEWCRNLLAMIPVWDAAFADPGKEHQYQLNSSHERQFEEQQKETTEARYWAERGMVTI